MRQGRFALILPANAGVIFRQRKSKSERGGRHKCLNAAGRWRGTGKKGSADSQKRRATGKGAFKKKERGGGVMLGGVKGGWVIAEKGKCNENPYSI